MISRSTIFLAIILLGAVGIWLGGQQEHSQGAPPHPNPAGALFSGYPPTVYMHTFFACPRQVCTRKDSLEIDSIPPGCCLLTISNGDGHGTDEVQSYEIFVNHKLIASSHHKSKDFASLRLRRRNTVEARLRGEGQSKLSVMIVYDARQH